MAELSAPKYAQLPVFQYQTFEPGELAYSSTPFLHASIVFAPHGVHMTDRPSKSVVTPKENPADSDTIDTRAELNSEQAVPDKGWHTKQHPPRIPQADP